jgi:archaellum component FlaC
MDLAINKRCWRFAATALVGGGLAVAGWFQFLRPATADQTPNLSATVGDRQSSEPGTWYRSSRTSNQSGAEGVIRTSSLEPQTPVATGPVVPIIPPAKEGYLPPSGVFTGGPRSYDAGLIGSATPLPSIPVVPASGVQELTTSNTLPEIPAAVSPPLDTGLTPTPPAAPVLPVPMPTMGNPLTPDLSTTNTVVSPAANLTSLSPPLKFPDTIQPIIPVQPVSSLPLRNEGISVKTESLQNGGWVQSFPDSPALLPVQGVTQPINPPVPLPNLPAIPVVGLNAETTATVLDRPKAIEATLPYSEKYTFPLPVSRTNKTLTPGENIMFNFYDHTAALAVIGGLFLAPAMPMNAQAGDDKTEIAELKAKVDKTNEKLTEIQANLKRLTEMLDGKKDGAGFIIPSDPGVVAQLKQLKDNLALVEQGLNTLKTQTSASSSLRPGNVPLIPDPMAGKGIIKIVNEYPVAISMVINGTSYPVQPTKVVDVAVPAGEFVYQLLQSGNAATRSTIKEKETVTLRIK